MYTPAMLCAQRAARRIAKSKDKNRAIRKWFRLIKLALS